MKQSKLSRPLHPHELRLEDMPEVTFVDLTWSDLRGANLTGADRSDANPRYADLFCVNLHGIDLKGAELCRAILDWHSHDLLAEILRQPWVFEVFRKYGYSGAE